MGAYLIKREMRRFRKWSERCRGVGLTLRLIPSYEDSSKQAYLVASEEFIFGISKDVHGVGESPQDAWNDFFQKINRGR